MGIIKETKQQLKQKVECLQEDIAECLLNLAAKDIEIKMLEDEIAKLRNIIESYEELIYFQ